MRIKELYEFINSLEIDNYPSLNEFKKIGDMTALFYNDKKKNFIDLNYERGLLLYLLITKLRPKNVLEIGTASGYATLCMAWAMYDNNIDGKIHTIDPIPNNEKMMRAMDDNSGNGPHLENISVREIWDKIDKKEWIEKIIPICGYSGEVLMKDIFPKFDFIFIDAAHFFDGVKHDFLACLNHVNKNFTILFDDYVDRESYGVKKLIDNDISKKMDVTLIKTDTKNNLEKVINLHDRIYGMCLLDNNSSKIDLNTLYPKKERDDYIKNYLKFEKRLRNRNRVNNVFPVLKKIKFSFWK